MFTFFVAGAEAKKLYNDANVMITRAAAEGWFTAKAVVGIWPAGADDTDDVIVFKDESRSEAAGKFCFLRQQVRARFCRAFHELLSAARGTAGLVLRVVCVTVPYRPSTRRTIRTLRCPTSLHPSRPPTSVYPFAFFVQFTSFAIAPPFVDRVTSVPLQ